MISADAAQRRRGAARRLGMSLLTAALGLAAAATQAGAATYSAVDGASLSAAVQKADSLPGPSTIDLAVGTYAVDATVTISGDLTIVGPSAGGGKIVGSAVSPVGGVLFEIASGAHVTVVDVAVTGAGGEGGNAAIDDLGSMDVESSTLAGNVGAALLIEHGGVATLRNSTLSDGLGSAVVDAGSAVLVNSTIADNAGEGIDDRTGALSLISTIVAGNVEGDCSAPAHASDDSLDGDGSCGVGALGDTNPRLGALLASNGGPTPTQALAPGSPAIDSGDQSQCPPVDQRDLQRTDGRCDIGAYEAGAAVPASPPSIVPSGSAGSAGSAGGSVATPGVAGASPIHPGAGAPVVAPAVASAPSKPSVAVGLRGHGTLRGSGRSRMTFSLDARVKRPHGSFVYRDRTGGVWLRVASVASVSIDQAGRTARLVGSGLELTRRRRVRFAVTVVLMPGAQSLRVRLSDGYAGGGRVTRGAIAFAKTRA